MESKNSSILSIFTNCTFVDCTHEIRVGDIGWPSNPTVNDGKATEEGKPDSRFRVICPFRTHDANGFKKDLWNLSCDCGTHMDSPSHFKPGGRTITDIPMLEMCCPGVVVDVTAKVEGEGDDYELSKEDLLAWEERHGQIPENAFVCMKTGWSCRYRTARYANCQVDGDFSTMHFPGFSQEAAVFLYTERTIRGIGIDTCSLDPGNSTTFPVHVESLITHDKYQIENMDLSSVPEAGFTFVNLPLKIFGAPESLTRVMAIIPNI